MKKAFTLVELIVVITTLAILWTIAFVCLDEELNEARRLQEECVMENKNEVIKYKLDCMELSNDWQYSCLRKAKEKFCPLESFLNQETENNNYYK